MSGAEWVGALATAGAVVAVWWPIRLLAAQRAEQRFEDANPRNADGIIIGAEPIHVRGVLPGAVLLIHGFNDSPQAMASLAQVLHDHGWTVRVPALPGHARTLQEFARSGAEEWISAVRAEYRELHARHGRVAVAGMSMGGALAFILAAEEPEARAVVAIGPYLNASPWAYVLLALSPIAELGARYLAGGGGKSVHDKGAAKRMIAYRVSTPRLLRQLAIVTRRAFAALPRVRQPVLIIQSMEDARIPERLARRAFAHIASPDKTVDWVRGAGHVLTVDFGHEQRERRVVEWLATRL